MITRIQALKYRCFDRLDVDLHHYNVLAGANGSGKSTLMDIPLLFSDMLSSNELVQAFLEPSPSTNVIRAQRLRELTYCHASDYFSFVLEAALPQEITTILVDDAPKSIRANSKRWPRALRYEVRFEIFNDIELQIADESLWLVPENATKNERGAQIGKPVPSNWTSIIARESGQPVKIKAERGERERRGREDFHFRLRPDTLALNSLPLDASLFPAARWFIDMLKVGTLWYEPNILKLQQDSKLVSMKAIDPDAGNLPWLVLSLQREQPDDFNDWVAHVQTALPHIKKIEAIERADGFHAYLTVTYNGGYTIPSSGLSAGTLRILALTILPYLPNPPDIVCLEEPENGLHPYAIEAILQSLNSLYDSQVLLSTHSPMVLAHTKLSSVIVMQSENSGEKYAIAGDNHPRLQGWRGEIDLGSLFAAGVLE